MTISRTRGIYSDTGKTLKSSYEGTGPWHDTDDSVFYATATSVESSVFMDATATDRSKVIAANDQPSCGVPKWSSQAGGYEQGIDFVDRLEGILDFDLYVSASTQNTDNLANRVFTNQAVVHWQFNSTGTTFMGDLGLWNWQGAAEAGVFMIDQNGQKVDPATASWQILVDGSQPVIAESSNDTPNIFRNTLVRWEEL